MSAPDSKRLARLVGDPEIRTQREAERRRVALAHIANVTEWLTDDPHERVAYLQRVAQDALQGKAPA